MRIDGKTHARKATSLTVGFVSAVKDPAHEGAKSLVLKTREKKPMLDEKIVKSAYQAAFAKRDLDDSLYDMFDKHWSLKDALFKAKDDIAEDDGITDKKSALAEAFGEYLDHFRELGSKLLKPSEPTVKTIVMTPEQAEYYNTLDETNKTAFASMDDNARNALVSVAKTRDESITVEGETIMKSKVGEAVFKQMKAMQEKIEKSAEAEKVAKAKQIVEETLKNLPGEETEKTAVVLAIQSLPEKEASAVMKMLTSGDNLFADRMEPAIAVNKKASKSFDELVAEYIESHPGTKRSDAKMIVARTDAGKKAIEAEEDK
ncbi:hypothetical protein [Flyfo podovirus Tbat2_2]|nr:hypothetical protein [Flyfo podovirus Tbat2_2]